MFTNYVQYRLYDYVEMCNEKKTITLLKLMFIDLTCCVWYEFVIATLGCRLAVCIVDSILIPLYTTVPVVVDKG